MFALLFRPRHRRNRDRQRHPVPLVAATLIASTTSRLICPEGGHHALARNFLKDAMTAAHLQQEAKAGCGPAGSQAISPSIGSAP